MKALVLDAKQDLILQEFIDQRKWKSAVDHCDKRLKKLKFGADNKLQLNRLLVELKQQASQKDLLDDETIQYIAAHEPVLQYLEVCDDIAVIEFIEEHFENTGSELWKQACKRHQHDEELYQAWFDTKFRRGDFRDAAEAAMRWRMQYPEKGSELTMRLILCYHVSSCQSLSDAVTDDDQADQSKKDARMAVLLAQQVVKATQSSHDTPAGSKKANILETSADLDLVFAVFVHNKLLQEASTLINDPSLKSLISWDLVSKTVRLNSLIAGSETEFKNSSELAWALLKDAEETYGNSLASDKRWGFGESGDDMVVYSAYIDALAALKSVELIDRARGLIQSLGKNGSFNADLQNVRLETLCGSKEGALKAVQQFFDRYEHKPQATLVYPHITTALRSAFIASLMKRGRQPPSDPQSRGPASWTGKINIYINTLIARYELLFDYSVSDSKTAVPNSTIQELEVLITECMHVYMATAGAEPSVPAAENSIGDRALLLAARALIRLWSYGRSSALFQAQLVLQRVIQKSRYNYEALILLIRICRVQGDMLKAFEYFQRLQVKNLQQLNEAAILSNGVATVQSSYSKRGGLRPDVWLRTILAWAAKRMTTIHNHLLECVDHGSWAGACEAVDLKRRWLRTPGYVTAVSESVQLEVRYGRNEDSTMLQTLSTLLKSYTKADGTDFDLTKLSPSSMVVLTHAHEKIILDRFDDAIVQKSLEAALILSGLHTIVRALTNELQMSQLYAVLYSPSLVADPISAVAIAIAKSALNLKAQKKAKGADIENFYGVVDGALECLLSITKHNDDGGDGSRNATCSSYAKTTRRNYRVLDILDVVEELIGWADRSQKLKSDFVTRVRKSVKEQRSRLVEWTRTEIRRVQGSVDATVAHVQSGPLGSALAALCGTPAIEASVHETCQNVVDTLEGLQMYAMQRESLQP